MSEFVQELETYVFTRLSSLDLLKETDIQTTDRSEIVRDLATSIVGLENLIVVPALHQSVRVDSAVPAHDFRALTAGEAKLDILAVDFDPQSNLSQYFLGAEDYLEHINSDALTVTAIFDQYAPPTAVRTGPTALDPSSLVVPVREWSESCLDLIPSRLELAWTCRWRRFVRLSKIFAASIEGSSSKGQWEISA